MSLVEADVGPDWDPTIDWAGIAAFAVSDAGLASGFADMFLVEWPLEVSIRFTNDAEVHTLNRDYRGKDKPTNVLSFPQYAPDDIAGLIHSNDPEILLGDIVLAFETCQWEAMEKGITLADHIAHLIVHGTLHLLGYDHMDDAAAEAMEALEVKALATLGIANPYLLQS